jgi:hypothetical protein
MHVEMWNWCLVLLTIVLAHAHANADEKAECSNVLLSLASSTGLAAEGEKCAKHSECGADHCGWTGGGEAKCCCRGYRAGYCFGLELDESCGADSQCKSGRCQLNKNTAGISHCGEATAPITKEVTTEDLSQGIVLAYLSTQVYYIEVAAKNGRPRAEVESMPCIPNDAVKTYLPKITSCNNIQTYFDQTYSGYGYTAALADKMIAVFAGTTPSATDTMDMQIDGMSALSSAVLLGPDDKSFGAGAGFVVQYNAMRSKGFDPAALCASKQHVLVTGHSLGGALANLAAVDLFLHGCSVELTTFGSTRVFAVLSSDTKAVLGSGASDVQAMVKGNDRFTARRWVNEGDGVTSYPPGTMNFAHVATDVISLHHMWWWGDGKRTFSFEAQDYSAYHGGVTIGVNHLMGNRLGYIPRILEGLGYDFDAAPTAAPPPAPAPACSGRGTENPSKTCSCLKPNSGTYYGKQCECFESNTRKCLLTWSGHCWVWGQPERTCLYGFGFLKTADEETDNGRRPSDIASMAVPNYASEHELNRLADGCASFTLSSALPDWATEFVSLIGNSTSPATANEIAAVCEALQAWIDSSDVEHSQRLSTLSSEDVPGAGENAHEADLKMATSNLRIGLAVVSTLLACAILLILHPSTRVTGVAGQAHAPQTTDAGAGPLTKQSIRSSDDYHIIRSKSSNITEI